MQYSRNEIASAIDRSERYRALDVVCRTDPLHPELFGVPRWGQHYLMILGGVAVGFVTTLITIGFNYLLFNWILHLEF